MTQPSIEQIEARYIDIWSKAHPPLRPAPGVLAFYERWMRRALPGGRGRLLILGSTAELRDLALRHGLRPACADLSARIWEAMRALMKEKGDEAFLHGNWLDLPEDRPWDAIFGDGSLTMMPASAVGPFLAKLRRLVAPDGVVVLRFGARTRSLPLESFGEAVRDFHCDGGDRTLYEHVAFLINALRCEHHPDMGTREFVEAKLMRLLPPEDQAALRAQLLDWPAWQPEKPWLEAQFAQHFTRADERVNDEPGTWGVSFVQALRPRES